MKGKGYSHDGRHKRVAESQVALPIRNRMVTVSKSAAAQGTVREVALVYVDCGVANNGEVEELRKVGSKQTKLVGIKVNRSKYEEGTDGPHRSYPGVLIERAEEDKCKKDMKLIINSKTSSRLPKKIYLM